MNESDQRASQVLAAGISIALSAQGKSLRKFVYIWAAIVILGPMVISVLSGHSKKDDTDSKTQRSGIRVHTDHRTGCQYLSVIKGGITPILNKNGLHAGCK